MKKLENDSLVLLKVSSQNFFSKYVLFQILMETSFEFNDFKYLCLYKWNLFYKQFHFLTD